MRGNFWGRGSVQHPDNLFCGPQDFAFPGDPGEGVDIVMKGSIFLQRSDMSADDVMCRL